MSKKLTNLIKMGRYYYGGIGGKFWFAIQSSDDVENIVSTYSCQPELMWKVCGCNKNCNNSKSYCQKCYSSYEEHYRDVCEDEDDDVIQETIDNFDEELFIETNMFNYYIPYNDNTLEDIMECLEEIEDTLKAKNENYIKILGSLEVDNDDGYEYTYNGSFDIVEKKDIYLFARYGLAKQMKTYFEDNEDDLKMNVEC